MADFSKLKINSTTYNVKDSTARTQITHGRYLYGKNIVAYGDSTGQYTGNYVQMLIDTYGLTITNRCIGGTEMTTDNSAGSSGLTRITAATDLNNFDICLVIYGINDWQNNASPNAFKNAYRSVCSVFAGTTCEPIFIFPWYCYKAWTYSDFGWTIENVNLYGHDLPSYIDSAIEIVNQYGYKYINMYTAAGVNRENYSTWLVNNGGIYVHALPALSERACDIICSDTFNNGKCWNFSSDNYAGFLYNNISISNNSTAADYIYNKNGMFFQANSDSNPIPLYIEYDSSVESTPVCCFKIRGRLRQSVTRTRLAFGVGSAVQYAALASGITFEFMFYAIGGTLQVTLDFPSGTASTAVAELLSLEVYCDHMCHPSSFDMTKASGVATAFPAKVYVDDGMIKFTPFDITLSAAKAAQTILLTSPLHLNGFATTAAILYRGTTRSVVNVFSSDRHIVCDTALQSGDRLSFQFPDIKITPHNNQHG